MERETNQTQPQTNYLNYINSEPPFNVREMKYYILPEGGLLSKKGPKAPQVLVSVNYKYLANAIKNLFSPRNEVGTSGTEPNSISYNNRNTVSDYQPAANYNAISNNYITSNIVPISTEQPRP